MTHFDTICSLIPIDLTKKKTLMRDKLESEMTYNEFHDSDTSEFEESDDLREFFVDP